MPLFTRQKNRELNKNRNRKKKKRKNQTHTHTHTLTKGLHVFTGDPFVGLWLVHNFHDVGLCVSLSVSLISPGLFWKEELFICWVLGRTMAVSKLRPLKILWKLNGRHLQLVFALPFKFHLLSNKTKWNPCHSGLQGTHVPEVTPGGPPPVCISLSPSNDLPSWWTQLKLPSSEHNA